MLKYFFSAYIYIRSYIIYKEFRAILSINFLLIDVENYLVESRLGTMGIIKYSQEKLNSVNRIRKHISIRFFFFAYIIYEIIYN